MARLCVLSKSKIGYQRCGLRKNLENGGRKKLGGGALINPVSLRTSMSSVDVDASMPGMMGTEKDLQQHQLQNSQPTYHLVWAGG